MDNWKIENSFPGEISQNRLTQSRRNFSRFLLENADVKIDKRITCLTKSSINIKSKIKTEKMMVCSLCSDYVHAY